MADKLAPRAVRRNLARKAKELHAWKLWRNRRDGNRAIRGPGCTHVVPYPLWSVRGNG